MKIAITSFALGLLALTGGAAAWAAGSSADTEKAIAALEMKWAQAESENTPDKIAPLLAEKLIVTESDGHVVNRTEFLAEEKASHYTSSAITDLKVTVFGNTAIATYGLDQKGTDPSGAFDRHSRETDTWMKMPNGAWQCVAAHTSKIDKK